MDKDAAIMAAQLLVSQLVLHRVVALSPQRAEILVRLKADLSEAEVASKGDGPDAVVAEHARAWLQNFLDEIAEGEPPNDPRKPFIHLARGK